MKLKGFTLIELLVVIAIIALLATVIITPIRSAIKEANCKDDNTCKAQTLEEYCDTYKDFSIRSLPVKCYKYFGINGAVDVSDK